MISSLMTLKPLSNDPLNVCKVDFTKYLGTWFEIGRSEIIRNTFEKDSACVVAQYSLKQDGTINVFNSNVDARTNQFKSITGSARILSAGKLKVTFGKNTIGGRIGEFFQKLIPGANYNVQNIWVDENGEYKRALVTSGKSFPARFQFIWILSRDEDISDAEISEYLDYAKKAGYDVEGSNWMRTPNTNSQKEIRKQNLGF